MNSYNGLFPADNETVTSLKNQIAECNKDVLVTLNSLINIYRSQQCFVEMYPRYKVNRDHVVSVEWKECNEHGNPGKYSLVITFVDGRVVWFTYETFRQMSDKYDALCGS